MAKAPADPDPTPYETIETDRGTTESPTEPVLEAELPGGRDAHDPYAAFRFPDFRRWLAGNVMAMAGGVMLSVTLGYELQRRTNSATALGLVGLFQMIPVISLSLVGGQVADRVSRKRIILTAQSIWIIVATSLAFAALFHAQLPRAAPLLAANAALTRLAAFLGEKNAHFDDLHIPLVYLLLFIGGVVRAFNQPAKQSVLPLLVPPRVFSNAVTWNSSTFELCSVAGPAVAGGLIAALQLATRNPSPTAPPAPDSPWVFATIYFLNAGLQLGQFLMVLRIAIPQPPRAAEPPGLGSLLAGLRFVWTTKILLATLSLDLFAVLLGGATALLPKFADEILAVGPVGFGLMRAAPSVGALATAMAVAHLPPMRHAGRNLLVAVAGFGAATVVFGLSRNFPLSLAMLIVTGACDNISVIIRHTLVQLLTPDHMRGRVNAVNAVFIGSSNELGALESGLTAAMWGPRLSVAAGGLGTLAVVAAVGVLWPQVRTIKKLADAAPPK